MTTEKNTTATDPEAQLADLVWDIKDAQGFITTAQLATLAQLDRLRPVLVRCGGGRFTAAAQDAAHFIGIIERDFAQTRDDREAMHLSDYLRDVSLPATDRIFR